MSFSTFRTPLLLRNIKQVFHIPTRLRRVNVGRPLAPGLNKLRVLQLTKPIVPADEQEKYPPLIPENCKKLIEKNNFVEEENPYEDFLVREMWSRVATAKMVLIFHANPVSYEEKFRIFRMLKKEQSQLAVYNNKIAKRALGETNYSAALQLFISHTAVMFCQDNNLAAILKLRSKMPYFVLMAGIVDGRLMSVTELEQYSKLPNLDLSRAQLCNTLGAAPLSLSQNLMAGQLTLTSSLRRYCEKDVKSD